MDFGTLSGQAWWSKRLSDKVETTLNESALERRESILQVFSVQSLLGLKENEANNNVTHHKEKSKTRMRIDSTDGEIVII